MFKNRNRKRKKRPRTKRRTCCERCRRRIRKWFCRRIKRCFKKAVFGSADPHLDEYEIAGYNLGDLKGNLKFKRSSDSFENSDRVVKRNSSIKNSRKKPAKSVDLKEALAREFDSLSISSVIGKAKSFVTDFRERNLFLGMSQDSKLKLNEKDKEKFRKLADTYKTKNKNEFENYMSLYEDPKKVQKKFSLTNSKTDMLKNMLNDYKKGKFNFSKISISKDKRKINDFNKEDLHKILNRYQTLKKKDRISSSDNIIENIFKKNKRMSVKQFEFLKNQDSNVLKKELSLTKSRIALLRNMADDLKRGKFSLTGVPSNLVKNKNNIQKEDLQKVLHYYKSRQKIENNIKNNFVKQSKLKQFKSDMRAKFGY